MSNYKSMPKLNGLWVLVTLHDGSEHDGLFPHLDLLQWNPDVPVTLVVPDKRGANKRITFQRKDIAAVQVLRATGSQKKKEKQT